MEKRFLIVVFIIGLFGTLVFLPLTSSIAGFDATGRASTQGTNVSIFVNPSIPSVEILSPKNNTYLKNHSILLDFSQTLADNLWYSIDKGENVSISGALYINTSQGNHFLILYANNSGGITTANITFATNSTAFIIYYENYKGSSKGSSTEFINYTYEEIQSLSDIVLENSNFGKVAFSEAINLIEATL